MGEMGKVLLTSLVAHTARTYPGFHSMKRLGILLLPLDGMLVHHRLTSAVLSGYSDSLPVPIYTPNDVYTGNNPLGKKKKKKKKKQTLQIKVKMVQNLAFLLLMKLLYILYSCILYSIVHLNHCNMWILSINSTR